MKNATSYLKMRVLGAIESAPRKTQQERVENVAKMIFIDEYGEKRQFTWRTIYTWYYKYKNSLATPKINQDDLEEFILSELDRVGLGHNTFTDDALSLIIRSSDGILRKARNLSLASLLEAVRLGRKIIDIEIINRVLIQPHWRVQNDLQAAML